MSKETQIIQKSPFIDLFCNDKNNSPETSKRLKTDFVSYSDEGEYGVFNYSTFSPFSDNQDVQGDTKTDDENDYVCTSTMYDNAENIMIPNVQTSPKKSKYTNASSISTDGDEDLFSRDERKNEEVDSEDDLVRSSYFDSHRKPRSTSTSSIGSKMSQSSPALSYTVVRGAENMSLGKNCSDDSKSNFSLQSVDDSTHSQDLQKQLDNLVQIYIQCRDKYQGFVEQWDKLCTSSEKNLHKLELHEDSDVETYLTQAPNDDSLELLHNIIIGIISDISMQLAVLKTSLSWPNDLSPNELLVNQLKEWMDDTSKDEINAWIDLAIFHAKHAHFEEALHIIKETGCPNDSAKALNKTLDILLEIQNMGGDTVKVNNLASSIDNYQNERYSQELRDTWKNSLNHHIDRAYKDTISLELIRSGHSFSELFFRALSEMDYIDQKWYNNTLHELKENLIHAAKSMVEHEHDTTAFKNYLSDFVRSGHVEYVIPYKALVEKEGIDWTTDRASDGGVGAGRFMYVALGQHLGNVDDMWNEIVGSANGGQIC